MLKLKRIYEPAETSDGYRVLVDKAGAFVVIELKAGKAVDSVCGQILGYIAWVRKELAGGKKVRGGSSSQANSPTA